MDGLSSRGYFQGQRNSRICCSASPLLFDGPVGMLVDGQIRLVIDERHRDVSEAVLAGGAEAARVKIWE